MKSRWTFLLAMAAACSSADSSDNSCGDHSIGGAEQCDDGNKASGDGCSATCMVENPGNAVCGDGVVDSSEGCDDSNTAPDDGCSATCTVEDGFTCTGMPSVCEPDGGAAAGTCADPYLITLTNNNGTLEGTAMGDTTGGTDQVAEAACDGFDSGAGPDHVWRFTLPDTRDVIIMTVDTSAFDTAIRLLSAPCDIATELPEFTGADGCSDGEGANEFLGYVSLPAGTYYVVLDGYTATDLGMYSFNVIASAPACGDGKLDLLEFCDDGDTDNADGCNAKCEVEDGYTCDSSEPSVCAMGGGGSAVPPAPGDLKLNEFMAGDNMSDTNCDGSTTGTADEFIELVNVSNKTLDLEGVTIADSVVVRHTFGPTQLAPGKAFVVWNAGTPMCAGVTAFDVARSGQLGLNDGGDTITVATGGASPTTLIAHTYPAATLNMASNLNPDVTGTNYAAHNTLTGAVGNFSPGKRANGTAF